MNTKRMLLMSTGVAAALAFGGDAQASGLYISAFGGANWLQSASNHFATGGYSPDSSQSLHATADTGFVLGAAVGLHLDNWLNGVRTEFEVSYRRNDVHGDWSETSDGTDIGPFVGHESTFAMMVNAWYDIDIGSKLRPYIGGGVGAAVAMNSGVIIDVDGGEGFVDERFDNRYFGMAWQLGVGGHYEVMPGVDLGLGYRYFRGPDFHYAGSSGDWEGTLRNENHSVVLDLTIGIN
jgi:opacity protein-like surface antigen